MAQLLSSIGIGPQITMTLPNTPFNGMPHGLQGINSRYNVYNNHFENYLGPAAAGNGGGWVVTMTGAGAVTLAPAIGGILALTTSAADNDAVAIQSIALPWVYKVGKRLWFLCRVATSDADDGEMLFGLGIADTSPIASLPGDGIFFEKAETATKMDFHARKAGTSTERTAVGPTLADAAITTFELSNQVYYGFAVSESGQIDAFAGPSLATMVNIANIPVGNANIPNTAMLALHFAFQTGAALAKSMYIDEAYVAMEI